MITIFEDNHRNINIYNNEGSSAHIKSSYILRVIMLYNNLIFKLSQYFKTIMDISTYTITMIQTLHSRQCSYIFSLITFS